LQAAEIVPIPPGRTIAAAVPQIRCFGRVFCPAGLQTLGRTAASHPAAVRCALPSAAAPVLLEEPPGHDHRFILAVDIGDVDGGDRNLVDDPASVSLL
jgi:hypothetical protein